MADERDVSIGEVRALLARLTLPTDVRHAIMRLIQQHAGDDDDPLDPGEGESSMQVRVARALYKNSLRWSQHIGPRLAGDTAWNMLLDLFIAHEEGRSISVSSLCIASGGPQTTALRQIGRLEQDGLVMRYDDERDGRRSWVRPTPEAIALVRGFVIEWGAMLRG